MESIAIIACVCIIQTARRSLADASVASTVTCLLIEHQGCFGTKLTCFGTKHACFGTKLDLC